MTCSECDAEAVAKGLCRLHYNRRWRAARSCEVGGCEKEVLGRGLCSAHYARWSRHGDTSVVRNRWDGFDRRCEVAGCDLKHYGQGLCKRHYRERFPERTDRPWIARSEGSREAERRRKATHPGRFAHRAVRQAILAGDLERGGCEVCGDPNSHAHHEDYGRPLDVRWLCARHHAEVHREYA